MNVSRNKIKLHKQNLYEFLQLANAAKDKDKTSVPSVETRIESVGKSGTRFIVKSFHVTKLIREKEDSAMAAAVAMKMTTTQTMAPSVALSIQDTVMSSVSSRISKRRESEREIKHKQTRVFNQGKSDDETDQEEYDGNDDDGNKEECQSSVTSNASSFEDVDSESNTSESTRYATEKRETGDDDDTCIENKQDMETQMTSLDDKGTGASLSNVFQNGTCKLVQDKFTQLLEEIFMICQSLAYPEQTEVIVNARTKNVFQRQKPLFVVNQHTAESWKQTIEDVHADCVERRTKARLLFESCFIRLVSVNPVQIRLVRACGLWSTRPSTSTEFTFDQGLGTRVSGVADDLDSQSSKSSVTSGTCGTTGTTIGRVDTKTSSKVPQYKIETHQIQPGQDIYIERFFHLPRDVLLPIHSANGIYAPAITGYAMRLPLDVLLHDFNLVRLVDDFGREYDTKHLLSFYGITIGA